MPTDETNEDKNLNKDGGAESNQPENFEVWLQAQPENIKQLYETHVTGLKNTVAATRTERDDFKKQLGTLAKAAEKGSETEKLLQEALGKIDVAERRATFMEEAIRPEIGCKNPRTAYALATAEELFGKNGSPDWTQIKAAAPELFGAGNAKGKAGAGTGEELKTGDMNAYIRKAAGV
ncbi:MAG: hypothetical protein A2Y53_06965 [Chloroflexi bacterium RBG_16_47_49]|nr:MAG: hypothetical protein A2Y53_06965 [Chloroflexi bacterium RBG_16_47_49]